MPSGVRLQDSSSILSDRLLSIFWRHVTHHSCLQVCLHKPYSWDFRAKKRYYFLWEIVYIAFRLCSASSSCVLCRGSLTWTSSECVTLLLVLLFFVKDSRKRFVANFFCHRISFSRTGVGNKMRILVMHFLSFCLMKCCLSSEFFRILQKEMRCVCPLTSNIYSGCHWGSSCHSRESKVAQKKAKNEILVSTFVWRSWWYSLWYAVLSISYTSFQFRFQSFFSFQCQRWLTSRVQR